MPDQNYVFRISFPAGDFSGAQAGQAALEAINASAGKVAASAAQAGVATDRFTDATGKLREANGRFVSTGQSVDEVKKRLSEAEHEADHFFESLKAGVNIDLGHRIVEGIAEVPAKFREIIEEGVRFNAQMETMQIGLAGAFRSSDPDRFGNFHAAEVAGTEALAAIQAKANELGLSFHALGEGLSINMHALAEGGVTDIKQQIDLIATLNQAAQAKGLDGARAGRDIIDLLQGRANRTLFGAELGIRDEDVKMAREAGKLYEFLSDKLSAYKEGGQAAASTFAAAEQRLTNETEQLYATVSRPIFEALKDALNDINNQLKDGKTAEELKGLGHDIAELAKDGATLLKWGIEVAPVLFRVAEGVGAVSLAIALLKLPGIIASLGQKSLAWLRNAEAIETETAALVENTAAAEANAAAKVASGGAGAAAGAGGFLSTAGAGAAVGGGLVALEAGYALIKLWESAKNQQIDALHEQSEVGSAAVLAAQKQIDAADTAEKKEKARLDIVKQIADRPGERESFTIHGYRDPDPGFNNDAGGGLHTGSLRSGGLRSSGITPDGLPLSDASGRKFGDPAAALAAAPSVAKLFAPIDPGVYYAQSVSGRTVPPAGEAFAPAVAALGQPAGGTAAASAAGATSAQGGPNGGGNDKLATAAERTAGSARNAERSAERAAAALEKLDQSLRGIESHMDQIERKADNALSQIANRA